MNKRRVLFCFYSGNIEQDMALLEDLESKGYEVELFTDLDPAAVTCGFLPSLIADLFGEQAHECDFYIASNMEAFTCLTHIFNEDLIKASLLLSENSVKNPLSGLYKELLEERCITGYSNFYVTCKTPNMPASWIVFEEDFKPREFVKEATLEDFSLVHQYLKDIFFYSNNPNAFYEDVVNIYEQFASYRKTILQMQTFEKAKVMCQVDQWIQSNGDHPHFLIFLYSEMVLLFGEEKYLIQLLDLIIQDFSISKEQKFFVYYQCIRRLFINIELASSSVKNKMRQAYNTLVDLFSKGKKYPRFSKEERNKNIIFVLTTQLLGLNHAPTKMALEMAYQVRNCLDKQVLIVNTKEFLPKSGILPMSDIVVASLETDYEACNAVAYKHIDMALYQLSNEMPNDIEITKFLNSVSKHKPDLVLVIGNSLLGDLCSELVPTVTIPTGRDGYSKSTFYAVDDEAAKNIQVKDHERVPSSIIMSRARFDLEAQRTFLERKSLGLEENSFVIGVIGTRLNLEIDSLFLELLERFCQREKVQVLFMSEYHFGEAEEKKYPNLFKKSLSIGYQNDLKAAIEHIDIYLNPFRNGGGVSALYAMDMGKPVVTLSKGDVSVTSGHEFSLNHVEEMYARVMKYMDEPDYYSEHSKLAKNKAFMQTDTCSYIKEIYEAVINSPLY